MRDPDDNPVFLNRFHRVLGTGGMIPARGRENGGYQELIALE